MSGNPNEVFFTVEVRNANSGGTNLPCASTGLAVLPDTFQIICDTPPQETWSLHYVVGNLPEHAVGG